MLGISTVWKSKTTRDGNKLIKEMLDLELDGIELEYRISDQMFGQMRPTLNENKTPVLSIHNFFPVPETVAPNNGNGDVFLLSSTNNDERKDAIKYTIKTIQIADDLGAKAVVLHLGRVAMETIKHELFEFYDSKKIGSAEYIESMRKFKEIRAKGKRKCFDALLMSIEKLLREADRYNINLGIENRYYFREFPNFDEIGYILEKFKGGNLGYWHDVGHAKVNENLGLIGSEMFLEAYGKDLLGIHLHDVNGYIDHIAPGCGNVNFKTIAKYLKPETIKIIEVHPKVDKDDLMKGINFLKEKGIT
ncbi:MAG: sugar phosphate isomerase/epimerase family protein [Candidatus Anammoxibacter sp.]